MQRLTDEQRIQQQIEIIITRALANTTRKAATLSDALRSIAELRQALSDVRHAVIVQGRQIATFRERNDS